MTDSCLHFAHVGPWGFCRARDFCSLSQSNTETFKEICLSWKADFSGLNASPPCYMHNPPGVSLAPLRRVVWVWEQVLEWQQGCVQLSSAQRMARFSLKEDYRLRQSRKINRGVSRAMLSSPEDQPQSYLLPLSCPYFYLSPPPSPPLPLPLPPSLSFLSPSLVCPSLFFSPHGLYFFIVRSSDVGLLSHLLPPLALQ